MFYRHSSFCRLELAFCCWTSDNCCTYLCLDADSKAQSNSPLWLAHTYFILKLIHLILIIILLNRFRSKPEHEVWWFRHPGPQCQDFRRRRRWTTEPVAQTFPTLVFILPLLSLRKGIYVLLVKYRPWLLILLISAIISLVCLEFTLFHLFHNGNDDWRKRILRSLTAWIISLGLPYPATISYEARVICPGGYNAYCVTDIMLLTYTAD